MAQDALVTDLLAAAGQGVPGAPAIDDQEMGERTEAAEGLDEGHLVDYAYACVEESRTATRKIREEWSELWRMSENEMEFPGKEEWQSRIALDKPHATVQAAKAIIRKALVTGPKFFSLTPYGDDPLNAARTELWEKSLQFWVAPERLNYAINFVDAAEMGFRIGLTHYQKLIPREGPPYRMELHLIEPWKVYRDPDSMPRKPFSGMYCIHQDYVDWHILKQGERDGRYFGVERIRGQEASEGSADGISGTDDKRSQAQRRQLEVTRHRFRKSYLTTEFAGTLLNQQGDLLLPNSTYTVSGRAVIRGPFVAPFMASGATADAAGVRWPMVACSPITHPLRFEGRGLLSGVKVLWKLMNQLFSLHVDNLNFQVLSEMEADMSNLYDPTDSASFPGKIHWKKGPNQVFTEIRRQAKSPEVLANLDAIFKLWQEFSFVSEFSAGVPNQDSRQRTARETEIKSTQALGVFESIGKDLEGGIIDFLSMLYEILLTTWDAQDQPGLIEILGKEHAQAIALSGFYDQSTRDDLLRMRASFSVAGVSALLAKQDQLNRILVIKETLADPQLGPMFKPYEVAKEITDGLDLTDKGVLKTPQEVQAMMEEQAAMAQQQATQQQETAQNETRTKAGLSELSHEQKMEQIAAGRASGGS